MENLDKVYANCVAQEYAPKVTTNVVKLKKLDKKLKTLQLFLLLYLE